MISCVKPSSFFLFLIRDIFFSEMPRIIGRINYFSFQFIPIQFNSVQINNRRSGNFILNDNNYSINTVFNYFYFTFNANAKFVRTLYAKIVPATTSKQTIREKKGKEKKKKKKRKVKISNVLKFQRKHPRGNHTSLHPSKITVPRYWEIERYLGSKNGRRLAGSRFSDDLRAIWPWIIVTLFRELLFTIIFFITQFWNAQDVKSLEKE